MAGSGYATNSRRKILDFLKSNSDRTVTAADIDQYLKRNGDAVNITTIYRYLDKLATDGTVMKYVAEAGGKAVYQYVELGQHCEEHLHLTLHSHKGQVHDEGGGRAGVRHHRRQAVRGDGRVEEERQ